MPREAASCDFVTRRAVLRAMGVASRLGAGRARAQSAAAPPVIGFLNSASEATYAFNAGAFIEGLGQAGFVPGRNVTIEYRWADNDYSRLPALARDLAARK